MSNSKIGINMNVKSKMATDSLHDLSNSFVKVEKDGKRANTSIGGLTTSLGMLKKAILGVGVYKLARGFTTVTQSAMDSIESIHLFEVAMGDLAVETGALVDELSEISGMDRVKMLDTVGEYNLLARSMGVTAENAQVLSVNTNKLALDLSALTNRSVVKVQEDLRSGLIGQSKTMYKYGIDVTEAALKQEALNQGISKSVRHMSQGEKMALRYAVMIRQSALAHGDFANTIDRPANQIRIFSERILTLGRAIGGLFIPMIEKALPYLNAFVQLLIMITGFIGKAFKIPKQAPIKNMGNNLTNLGGSAEGMGDKLKGAGNKVGGTGKKMKKTGKEADKLKKKMKDLAGFDELNILNLKEPEIPDSDAGSGGLGGGGGGGGGGLGGLGDFGELDFNLEGYDNLLDGIKQKSDEILEGLMEKFYTLVGISQPAIDEFKKLWDEGLSQFMQFNFDTLSDFYSSFLVPVALWTLGKGLPMLFEITNQLLKSIDWDRLRTSLDGLYESLVPLAIFYGEGLLHFYHRVLTPLGTWVMNDAIIRMVDAISNGLGKINYDKITTSLLNLWDSMVKFTINVGDGLLWIFENVLVPLGVWTMNEVVPRFLDLLGGAFEFLNSILSASRPAFEWLMEYLLIPIAKWTGGIILVVLDSLVGLLEILAEFVERNRALFEDWFVIIELLLIIIMGAVGIFKIFNGVMTIVTTIMATLSTGASILGGVIAFLSTPLGLVIGVIGALIGIGVLLYKNWDKIKEQAGKLGKYITGIWDNIKKKYTETYNKLIEAWKPFVSWFGDLWGKAQQAPAKVWKWLVEKYTEVYNSLIDKWTGVIKWFSNLWGNVKKGADEQWNKISSGISKIWDGLIGTASRTFNSVVSAIKKAINVIPNYFKTTFTTAWNNVKRVFSTGGKIFTGIKDGIASTFKTIVNGLIGGINRVIRVPFNAINGMLNKIRSVSVAGLKPFSGFWGPNPIKVPSIPRLARGGQVGAGQMFIAGEAGMEVMGKHQGKSTVMPLENTSFVSAIEKAVARGVSSNNNSNDGGIVVKIGERTLVDILSSEMNRQSRINGKAIINV